MLGGYLMLFPRARVITVIVIIFFFTIVELPALAILGFWFVQQLLFGYFDLGTAGREGGVAYFAHVGGLRVRPAGDPAVRRRAQAAAADRARGAGVMARTLILGLALAFIAILGFLTLFVLFSSGPDVLVVLSLVVLGLFAFGVVGALSTPPRDG